MHHDLMTSGDGLQPARLGRFPIMLFSEQRFRDSYQF